MDEHLTAQPATPGVASAAHPDAGATSATGAGPARVEPGDDDPTGMAANADGPLAHTIMAGVVTALVGFTSSFAVVLTGLHAVGASGAQAASGLLALCVTMGLGCILFSWRLRMPVTLAWSTPGAALLATAATPHGGFAASVGAFIACGLLLALCGLVRPLARLVEAIPTPLAQAMLAGVLLELVVAPVHALQHNVASIAPVVVVWLLLSRFLKRWAVLGALATALVVMLVEGVFTRLDLGGAAPRLAFVTPHPDARSLLAIAVPLFIVTMTSQNIPGIAVLGSFGYRPGLRGPLLYTGATSMLGALFGGHAINLAAISAALAAGPEAGPNPRRRWIAGVACGVTYMAFGPLAGLVSAVAAAAPAGIIETIAGLALIATFASAAHGALASDRGRMAGAVAFVVAASGLSVGGIGAPFWSLVAGLVCWKVFD